MILIAFLHLKLSERQELAYIIPLTRARWETALSEAQALSSWMNYTGGKPDKTPDCGKKFSAAQPLSAGEFIHKETLHVHWVWLML